MAWLTDNTTYRISGLTLYEDATHQRRAFLACCRRCLVSPVACAQVGANAARPAHVCREYCEMKPCMSLDARFHSNDEVCTQAALATCHQHEVQGSKSTYVSMQVESALVLQTSASSSHSSTSACAIVSNIAHIRGTLYPPKVMLYIN